MGANKLYGGRILVSAATVAGADDAVETREIDRVIVLGHTHPQVIYEIMGRKGKLTQAQVELRTHYCEGLAAYRARNWEEAHRAFAAALESVPNDGPSMASSSVSRVLPQIRPTMGGTDHGSSNKK